MSLGPVVSGSRLSEDEVVGSEDLSEGSRSDRVHGSGLQVDEDGAGNVLPASRLVVIHVDALELEIAVAMVSACDGEEWEGEVENGQDAHHAHDLIFVV